MNRVLFFIYFTTKNSKHVNFLYFTTDRFLLNWLRSSRLETSEAQWRLRRSLLPVISIDTLMPGLTSKWSFCETRPVCEMFVVSVRGRAWCADTGWPKALARESLTRRHLVRTNYLRNSLILSSACIPVRPR